MKTFLVILCVVGLAWQASIEVTNDDVFMEPAIGERFYGESRQMHFVGHVRGKSDDAIVFPNSNDPSFLEKNPLPPSRKSTTEAPKQEAVATAVCNAALITRLAHAESESGSFLLPNGTTVVFAVCKSYVLLQQRLGLEI